MAERVADRALELVLVAFAAWTVVYHACVVLGLGTTAAIAGWVVAAVASGALLRRGPRRRAAAEVPSRPHPSGRPVLAVGCVVAAATAGVLFGLTSAPWPLVWAAWLVAAGCAVAWLGGGVARAEAGGAAAAGRLELAVVGAWMLGLAALSLVLRGQDGDDAYYVHLSSWIAAHGIFPDRDVVFSDQVFPALYFPPVSSLEALIGAVGRVMAIPVPDLVYDALPPVATALAVLALWRLLRAWGTPLVAVALSAALVFLLLDAGQSKLFGAFFAGRMWQGKVLFVAILVPLLFALLHEHAERPSRRSAALLLAAGAAGVGLTTSAIFVVPVIVAGGMAALAVRDRRVALAGLVAGVAYPATAGAVTLALGGRVPDVYTDADVRPALLVHFVLGSGAIGLVAIVAALAGPLLIARARPALMVAATILLVGVLFTPGVPAAIFHLTGLGRVLWRLTWALPVAALVGAAIAALAARPGPGILRAAPAAVLAVVLAVWGGPVWTAGAGELVRRPAWKRPPAQVAAARAILGVARPGDVVLAPAGVSQTILVASGTVTTVSPRGFYTKALHALPAARVPQRLALQRFADTGAAGPGLDRALRAVGVDLACVDAADEAAQRVLARAGYRPAGAAGRLACQRAGA